MNTPNDSPSMPDRGSLHHHIDSKFFHSIRKWLSLLAAAIVFPSIGMAEESVDVLNSGDTAWMLTATVLVLFMTLPGLALFYGGLVRSKNILSVLGQCFAIALVMTILWVAYGYSVAFSDGGSVNRFFGGFSQLFLKGVTVDSLSGTIPESVFSTFQMTFAIISPALIVGAFAERMKFSAMLLFCILWFSFSYLPICHMAWGGGLFADWGVLDFAGGTVVHINAGIAGLVACIMVGKRIGFMKDPIKPHNLPLTVIGAAMLWVGWFGFNAGSELAADGVAGMAMLVTQMAAATAGATWMFLEWKNHGKPSILGMVTGAVAGLVAITPASGSAGPMGAFIIGIAAGLFCYLAATKLKKAFQFDDSLDVFAVHGVGGIVGAILTGVCASTVLGGSGLDGTMGAQVWTQFLSVIVTIVWSGVVSVIVLKVLDATVGLRVTSDDERSGLDLSSHDEEGYST
jgi:Amt family ammonium transporter